MTRALIMSIWGLISSSIPLLLFLAAVYAAIRVRNIYNAQTTTTQSTLASKGVTYNDGKLSIQTDRAAPSREEYIASTQRAFEKGAKTMSLHPEAFRTGASRENSDGVSGVGSGVESPGQSGFRRTKKLA